MAKIFLVTSFKGGVGKSTVSANLAYKTAKAGKKTLLCDLDFDLGTLDLITGSENRMLFDICDAAFGRRDAEDCVVTFPSNPDLFLLGAPFSCGDEIEAEDFSKRLKKLCEGYDYVFLDTPGSDSVTLEAAALIADEAIVVATHNPASVRGAGKTADKLRENGLQCRLIVNCFDAGSVSDDKRMGMIAMIDSTRIQLLGVIPYDRALVFAQEKGVFADGDGFISSRAFDNVITRILPTGKRPKPILSGVLHSKRKKVLTK